MLNPNSPLAKFIQKYQLPLNLFFRPIELTSLIEDIATKENMYENGNYDIIFLSEELRLCFDRATVYIPNLYSLCLPHVIVVNEIKSSMLKNELIQNEIYVDSPLDIIYSDPSSKFWIPRQLINPYMCENNQIIFTWKELNTYFVKFITSPDSFITQMDNSMFYITEDSVFSQQFKFKHFHYNQIPTILKQVIKFLGKSNNILTLCPDLKFSDIGPKDKIVYWIEEIIQQNNNLTPYISSHIFL